jgi:hypothetical protein
VNPFLEWLGEELGEREWSSRRCLVRGRQQLEEVGIKGYKYPTPKNMTVRPLVMTCPEDTMWRTELPGSDRAETEDDFGSSARAVSSDLEAVSSDPLVKFSIPMCSCMKMCLSWVVSSQD